MNKMNIYCIFISKNLITITLEMYFKGSYRHTSGYINSLKDPKYTVNGTRYSYMQGYTGDRYSAEKWIMSNSKGIPSDLLSDKIDFSYNVGNKKLYKIWFKEPNSLSISPNSNILCSTVNYNDNLRSFPQSYYTLFINLIYDYDRCNNRL